MRRAVFAVLMATLVWTGACHANDAPIAPPTDTNVVGLYRLTVVNGGPLPFPYSGNTTSRLDIVGGSITLTPDHAFSDALVFRQTFTSGEVGPDQTQTLTGTWVLQTNTLTLTYTGHPPTAAVVTGQLLSLVDSGLSLTYSK